MNGVEHPFADRTRAAHIRRRWPLLSADDAAAAAGNRELLVIRIVERYGIGVVWAERQVAAWEAEQQDRSRTGS